MSDPIPHDSAIAQAAETLATLTEGQESRFWYLLCEAWRQSEREYDQVLHTANAGDAVRIATAQATCKVLRDVMNTPEKLAKEAEAVLKGAG